MQGLLKRYDGDCGQPPEEPKLEAAGAELETVSVLGQEGLERRGELGFLHGGIGQGRTRGRSLFPVATGAALLLPPETILSPVTPPASWKPGGLVLNESALSFLATLASSSSEEIELQLQESMEFSKAAVSRVVEVSDKIHRRTEELCQKIHARGEAGPPPCPPQVMAELRGP